ncbi:MAG: SMI1/KNR4 family protein [Phycisphaerales bacterium]|nr:SMI1/KNR4 family protein [Planctomycetota bacterium]MCH8508758.1 SMI1/KNR4 family protein [Phycisphaerales bacterium]
MPKHVQTLEAWAAALAPHVSRPIHFKIKPPFTAGALRAATADMIIPADVENFLCSEAAQIDFWWSVSEHAVPLQVADKPTDGYFEFNTESLYNINADRTGFLSPDDSDSTYTRWEHAFRFVGVPNGDAIALDIAASRDRPPVIYLNHEEPEKHIVLATSFESFIDAWFGLGCVGPEGWSLCHFVTDNGQPLDEYEYGTPTSRLDPACTNAAIFRHAFGF